MPMFNNNEGTSRFNKLLWQNQKTVTLKNQYVIQQAYNVYIPIVSQSKAAFNLLFAV